MGITRASVTPSSVFWGFCPSSYPECALRLWSKCPPELVMAAPLSEGVGSCMSHGLRLPLDLCLSRCLGMSLDALIGLCLGLCLCSSCMIVPSWPHKSACLVLMLPGACNGMMPGKNRRSGICMRVRLCSAAVMYSSWTEAYQTRNTAELLTFSCPRCVAQRLFCRT